MSYDYGYNYDVGNAVGTGLGAMFGFLIFVYIIGLAVGIFTIVCNWKVFKKAGKNGWEAIIPVYNFVVLLEITGLPMWYLFLFLVPVGNVVVLFLIYIELAKKFGQSVGFGVGLALLNPIFMAILAFNKNYVYQGTVAQPNTNTNNYNGVNNNYQNYSQPINNFQQNYNQPVNNFQSVNSQSTIQNEMHNSTSQPVEQPQNTVVVAPVVEQSQPINSDAVYNQVEKPIESTVNSQPVQKNNCSRCGAPVNNGDRFCMSCGNQL